mgnify:CR=1 FL=1
MLESNKTQTKLDSTPNKHLIINSAVLNPISTARVSVKDDLVLRQVEEGVFSVLKDGKQSIEYLGKLTSHHGYSIVLYSSCKQHQINMILAELDEVCMREGLKGFPKISLLVVKDREFYPQVKASELKVAENCSQERRVAGYSLQSQEESEILTGISKLINLSKSAQSSCIVLDNRPSFIKKARQEGWNVCDAGLISLKKVSMNLSDSEGFFEEPGAEGPGTTSEMLRDPTESKNKSSPQNSEMEEVIKEPLKNDCATNSYSSYVSETKDQTSQNTAGNHNFAQSQVEQTQIAPNDTKANIVHQTLMINSQNTGEFLYHQPQQSLKTDVAHGKFNENKDDIGNTPLSKDAEGADLKNDSHSQQRQQNSETKNAEKKDDASTQQLPQNKPKEDVVSQESLISDIEFEPLLKPSPGGSSFTRWFIDKEGKTEWIGKCSVQAVLEKSEYNEYKEYLASQLYELFGVKVPKTLLSIQYLDQKIQQDKDWGRRKGIDQPKLHIFSQVVPGFELLGKTFVEDYKNSSKKNRKELFCIGEGKVPLRGFGRVMAVAILTQDYDFIGNTGRNIGYIPVENGKYFEILKIDPGEALMLEKILVNAKAVHNPLNKRGAVVGTQGERINYNELNEIDQKEFVQTLKEILEAKPSKLEEIFSPFFGANPKFRIGFEEFLNRRQQLLFFFVSEVRNLITLQIMKIERQQAEKHALDWGKRPTLLTSEIEKKAELLRNKAQLEAFTVVEDSNSKDSKQFQVSHKKEVFVGRQSELSHLKKLFTGNNGILECAIVGGAGLGKSQLATEYIIRNQKEMYSETVWLHAEQSDLIVDQIQIYLETCHKMKFDPKDKVRKKTIIQRFFQIIGKEADDTNGNINRKLKKACVIFDNADGMAQIADYLPDKRSFPKLKIDILITSRYKKWEHPVDSIIELQAFGIEDVKNYISACIPNIATNQNVHQLAKDLNDLIGGLPLALSLAIAYIQQREMSVSEFCEIVSKENNKEFIPLQSQKESDKELQLIEDENEMKNINLVSTIFTLALADLRLKYYNVEPILDILAYLSPDDISTNLLAECWSYSHNKEYPIDSHLKYLAEVLPENIPMLENWKELLNIESSHEFIDDHRALLEDFRPALELLFSYSIITANPIRKQFGEDEVSSEEGINGMKISIHRLTQQVIRLNHRSSNHYERIYGNVFNWLVARLDYNEKDLKDIRRADLLVPHAIHLESLQNSIKDLKMIILYERIGKHQLFAVGKYDVAMKYFEKILLIKETIYGKDHPETGGTLANLGNAWGFLGDYEKQKNLLTRALEINGKYYDEDPTGVASILTGLGNAWGYLGDYEKQKNLLSRALEINKGFYGNDHPETGITLINLGSAWGRLGDYEKQKDLLTRALEINEKHYGKDHPQTGITLTNLGNAWGHLGDYEKQKDLLTCALKINEAYFGYDHPQTSITLDVLGNAWGSLGNYEKKKDLLLRALEIKERHYGKDHPETSATLHYLGNVWGQLGDYEKKKDLLIRALEIKERHYGKDHPETSATLHELGNAWGQLGDYEKKKDLLTRALEIKEKHYGKEHPETSATLEDLGNAWGSFGDYEKKKNLLTIALKINEKCYGRDHPKTGITLTNLGNVWGFLGDSAKEKDLQTRALEIFEKHYGNDHPKIGITLTQLGYAWGYLGDYKKKKDLLTRALEINEKHFGKDHPETSNTLNGLGFAWGALGDYKKQIDMLTRALEINEKHFGKYHRQTGATLANLGNAWGDVGDYEKKKDLLTRAVEIYEQHFGKYHPQTGVLLAQLGNALCTLGNTQQAYELLSRSLQIKKFSSSKIDPSFCLLLTDLGRACLSLKDFTQAEGCLLNALKINESFYGMNHINARSILTSLSDLYFQMKKFEKALEYQSRTHQIYQRNFGEDDKHRINSANRMKIIKENIIANEIQAKYLELLSKND